MVVDGGKNYESYDPYVLNEEDKVRPIQLTFDIIHPKKIKKVVKPLLEEYKMSKFPHGLAVIINNVNFKVHAARTGTKVDAKDLVTTFRYLGYKVRVYTDCTSDEMSDIFEGIKDYDHSKSDSFMCCILSHGSRGRIYGSDSEHVSPDWLTNRLTTENCPSLAGKPKLCFIQACRGNLKTGASNVAEDGTDEPDGALKQENTQEDVVLSSLLSDECRVVTDDVSIPDIADFYIGYATSPGHVSYRDLAYGSWFVCQLCAVLCSCSTCMSLEDMMMVTRKRVCEQYEHLAKKQAPESITRLRKEVFF